MSIPLVNFHLGGAAQYFGWGWIRELLDICHCRTIFYIISIASAPLLSLGGIFLGGQVHHPERRREDRTLDRDGPVQFGTSARFPGRWFEPLNGPSPPGAFERFSRARGVTGD